MPVPKPQTRVLLVQDRNVALLNRGEVAVVGLLDAIAAAKKAGATDAQLLATRVLQRKAQWRLDFISAENSMGFHAPQEAARILAEAIDYARQGELAVARDMKAGGGTAAAHQ
jgi:nitrite reductase (cytochrome c-552)